MKFTFQSLTFGFSSKNVHEQFDVDFELETIFFGDFYPHTVMLINELLSNVSMNGFIYCFKLRHKKL